MNLVEMRARVREDLQDEDPADYHWTDDQIDGAILRAATEYSNVRPIEQEDDVATTLNDRELDVSSLTDLIRVVSIEFPIGYREPHLQRFSFYAGKVHMIDLGTGADARVRWHRKHTLDAVTSTIPEEHDEIIILGATGYLAKSAAAYTVDRASIAGRWGNINYRAWGEERLQRYDAALATLARRLSIKQLHAEEG
jgi:hypothetical protein